jgi:hypothetical protein
MSNRTSFCSKSYGDAYQILNLVENVGKSVKGITILTLLPLQPLPLYCYRYKAYLSYAYLTHKLYTLLTTAGSKRKVRWVFGFQDREGDQEVVLVHSRTSGKKTIMEDGREISTSTRYITNTPPTPLGCYCTPAPLLLHSCTAAA